VYGLFCITDGISSCGMVEVSSLSCFSLE